MSRRLLTLIAAVACTFGVAACTEQLESGAGCPALCPQVPIDLRDTIIDAVVFDSSLAGFPAIGYEEFPLLADYGDSLQTRVIVRFDSLPTTFRRLTAPSDSAITFVDSAALVVRIQFPVIDSTIPMTIYAYDVDTVLPAGSAADTIAETLIPLFRPERLLGSVTFTPTQLSDTALDGDSTVRIPIDEQVLLSKITTGERLRVGLRLESPEGSSVRLAGQGSSTSLALRFRATPDTLVAPVVVVPRSRTPEDPFTQASLADYQIVVRGTLLPPGPLLAVGGVPGHRTYLQFDLPRNITDSSRVVRAAVLLTQYPNAASPRRSDTLALVTEVLVAGPAITNLRQALRFTSPSFGANGVATNIPVVQIVPGDSGLVAIEVAPLVAAWRIIDADSVPRAIVLRAGDENSGGGLALFFSSEAPANLRPRLRLTYAPRLEFGLP